MKKGLLILSACGLLALTSCGQLKNLISEIQSEIDAEESDDTEGEYTGGYDTDTNTNTDTNTDTNTGEETHEESEDERQLSVYKKYALAGGITISGTTVLGEFKTEAGPNAVKFNNGTSDMIISFEGDNVYQYYCYGDEWLRQEATGEMTYEDALEIVFAMPMMVTASCIDFISEATYKSTTYLGQAGKEYTYRETIVPVTNTYTWFVSDKDGFTLRTHMEQYNGDTLMSEYDSKIDVLSYSASIEIPTEYEEIQY